MARILHIGRLREMRIERSALIRLRAVALNEGCAGAFGTSPRAYVLFVVAVARTGIKQALGGPQGFEPFASDSASPGGGAYPTASASAGGGAGATAAHDHRSTHGRSGHERRTNGSAGKSQGSGHGGSSANYAALHAPSDSGGNALLIVILLLLGAAGLVALLGPDIRRAALRRRNGQPAGATAGAAGAAPEATEESPAIAPPLTTTETQADAAPSPATPSQTAHSTDWWRGNRSQRAMILASLGGALQLISRRRRAHRRRRR